MTSANGTIYMTAAMTAMVSYNWVRQWVFTIFIISIGVSHIHNVQFESKRKKYPLAIVPFRSDCRYGQGQLRLLRLRLTPTEATHLLIMNFYFINSMGIYQTVYHTHNDKFESKQVFYQLILITIFCRNYFEIWKYRIFFMLKFH